MSILGSVDWFSSRKGYGFITPLDPKGSTSECKNLFCHITNISGEGYKTLYPGEYVSFDINNVDGKQQCSGVTGVMGGKLMYENEKYNMKVSRKKSSLNEGNVDENVDDIVE
jgi:CspA family cold shock protein